MQDKEQKVEDVSAAPSKAIKRLVLDAAPLLTQAPIRGLAEEFYTTPQVIQELRDEKSKKHLEMLEIQGVHINVQQPDPISYAKGLIRSAFLFEIWLTQAQSLASRSLQVTTAFCQDQIWAFLRLHTHSKSRRMVQ